MSKEWTVAQEEKRAALPRLLGGMKETPLDAYRRGLGCGHESPIVGLRVADDFDRGEGSGLAVETIDPVELGRMSSMARQLPVILDVPRDHFRVVAIDETGDLLAIIALPIPAE